MARPSTYKRRRATKLFLALSAGANIEEAAQFGRIPRSTFYYWLRHSRKFQQAFEAVKQTLYENLEKERIPHNFRLNMWLYGKFGTAQNRYDLKHHPERWRARIEKRRSHIEFTSFELKNWK